QHARNRPPDRRPAHLRASAHSARITSALVMRILRSRRMLTACTSTSVRAASRRRFDLLGPPGTACSLLLALMELRLLGCQALGWRYRAAGGRFRYGEQRKARVGGGSTSLLLTPGHRPAPRAASSAVFALWQSGWIGRRLLSSSAPPSASGTTWSTSV